MTLCSSQHSKSSTILPTLPRLTETMSRGVLCTTPYLPCGPRSCNGWQVVPRACHQLQSRNASIHERGQNYSILFSAESASVARSSSNEARFFRHITTSTFNNPRRRNDASHVIESTLAGVGRIQASRRLETKIWSNCNFLGRCHF